ncbi:MAG: hypothetical protein SPI49_05890 [Eubacteriales bacterium]|nr:hypothetical protein [Eubacteriales bacterium]
MTNIVKLNPCWCFPRDGKGQSLYLSGVYNLTHKDNLCVYFYVGFANKDYYTDIKNAYYIGPDTQKATFTSVEASEFGAEATAHISNISNLRLTMSISIDCDGEHLEKELGAAQEVMSFTVPEEWVDIVKNSDSEYVSLKLQSWQGEVLFGEDIKQIKLSVPESIVPVIDDIELSPLNNKVPSSKGYFERIGRVKATVKAHATRGASLANISINGVSTVKEFNNTYILLSDILQQSGNTDITICAMDTRGRKAIATRSIKVKPYFFPYMTDAKLVRANSSGKIANEGLYAKPIGEISVSPEFQANLKLFNKDIECEKTNGVFGSFPIESSFELQLVLSDGYFEARYNLLLDSAYCLMNVQENAIAMGGYAHEPGFEVYMPLASKLKNKIMSTLAEGLDYHTVALSDSSYDDENLYSTRLQSDGNIFWIDESAEVYSITRAEGSIELRSNQNLQGKKLNIISIKNSDMLVFIGLSQKQTDILINTNIANKSNLIGKALQDGTVVFKTDRVECRPQSTSRKLIATKEIDITNYSRVRMYGKLLWEYEYAQYAAHFGILKPEILNDINSTNPSNAFTVMKRLTGLDENNFLEIDISQVNGMQHIGAFGIASWDTYKFELLR